MKLLKRIHKFIKKKFKMGEDIQGQWINMRTGHVVTARQIVNDGENVVVVTDAGLIPMTEFSNYTQMSEEEVGQAQQPNAGQISTTDMTAEDQALMSQFGKQKPEEPAFDINKPLTAQALQKNESSQIIKENNSSSTIKVETESENYKLINKVFNKFGYPKISVSIDWGEFPKEQLDNLIEIFDVPKEEIIEYLLEKLINLDNLKDEIEI